MIPNAHWGVNPVHISLAAFLDGYVDVTTFEMFHIYTTMMTGNLIKLAISLGRENVIDNFFAFMVIPSYLGGCYIAFTVMNKYKDNRYKSYLIMLPSQAIGILLVALIPETNIWYKFSVLPLVVSFGMLNIWGNRLGYTPQMMTGNMQKLTEALFKYMNNIPLTNDKEKCDNVLMLFILGSYFIGAVIASILTNIKALNVHTNPKWAILVMLIIIPAKLFFSKAYTVLQCDTTCFNCTYCPNTKHMIGLIDSMDITTRFNDVRHHMSHISTNSFYQQKQQQQVSSHRNETNNNHITTDMNTKMMTTTATNTSHVCVECRKNMPTKSMLMEENRLAISSSSSSSSSLFDEVMVSEGVQVQAQVRHSTHESIKIDTTHNIIIETKTKTKNKRIDNIYLKDSSTHIDNCNSSNNSPVMSIQKINHNDNNDDDDDRHIINEKFEINVKDNVTTMS